jgi:endonuclease G
MSKWLSLLITFALLGLVPQYAEASHRNCTVAEKKSADRQLWLSPNDKALSTQKHLPWGAPAASPAASNEWLLIQRDYVIYYDGDLRIPLFTAERVDQKRLKALHRTDCFRRDVRIDAPQESKPSDFDEPIFDQGHLAAFANQTSSKIAGNNSFVMSNMVPQTCQFNRGIWQILEGITRSWAKDKGTIYVISGSIMDRDGDGLRDGDDVAARMRSKNRLSRVAIPTSFYKIITAVSADGSLETLSILMPHNQANPSRNEALGYLTNHITSISDIEHRTGLDFFPMNPVINERVGLWPVTEMSNSLCRDPPRQDFDAIWQQETVHVSELYVVKSSVRE